MNYDIYFGAGLWDVKITAFYYDNFTGMFHITLQSGRVEQFIFSTSDMIHMGIINLDKIKELAKKVNL